MRNSRQTGFSFAPKTMFWVALMLVFAQVAHAFDACAAHLENADLLAMSIGVPCPDDHSCELCSLAPIEDACDSVSELATRVSAGEPLIAPPLIFVDAPFVALPIPALENSMFAPGNRYSSDVPPLRSQFSAPQLSGRAPPLSI